MSDVVGAGSLGTRIVLDQKTRSAKSTGLGTITTSAITVYQKNIMRVRQGTAITVNKQSATNNFQKTTQKLETHNMARDTMRHWKEKAEEYRDYALALETEYSRALEALKDIGVGLVSSSQPASWSTQTKLQNDAATFLQKQAAKNIKRPQGGFYP
jgi:hypothetical protein